MIKTKYQFTAEHRKKISEARKGMVFSKEHLENLRKARILYPSWPKGKKRTEEQKRKISIALMGHKQSEETKRKKKNCFYGKKTHIGNQTQNEYCE